MRGSTDGSLHSRKESLAANGDGLERAAGSATRMLNAGSSTTKYRDGSIQTMKIALNVWAALLLAAATPLHAQDYPKGSVTLVIPLAPGDATDTSARAIADELSRELKVAIVPVKPSRRGGALGTELVVKSKPDGYTIILTTTRRSCPLDPRSPRPRATTPLADLTPLGLAMRSPSILAVRGDAPYKTFAEMVEHSKKNRGACGIGTAGAGSVGDFCVLTLNSLTGRRLTTVAFTARRPRSPPCSAGMSKASYSARHDDGPLEERHAAGHRHLDQVSGFPGHPDAFGTRVLGTVLRNLVGFFAPANVPAEVTRRWFRRWSAPLNRPASARSSGLRDADGLCPAGEASRGDTRGAPARFGDRREVRTDQVGRRDGGSLGKLDLPAAAQGPCGTTIEELAWRRSSCSSRTVRSIASLAAGPNFSQPPRATRRRSRIRWGWSRRGS